MRAMLQASELELGHNDGMCTSYSLSGMHRKMPDEKGCDDIHQHLMDETRRRRDTNLGPLRIMRAVLDSQVVEAAGYLQ